MDPKRHRIATKTTCAVSDLLNELKIFIEDNSGVKDPWHDDPEKCKMVVHAFYLIKSKAADTMAKDGVCEEMVSREEFEFVNGLLLALGATEA